MEQLPSGQLAAKTVFFGNGVLAYNLGRLLKAQLHPPECRHATMVTLRWKLYRLADKLVRHAGGWALKIKDGGRKAGADASR